MAGKGSKADRAAGPARGAVRQKHASPQRAEARRPSAPPGLPPAATLDLPEPPRRWRIALLAFVLVAAAVLRLADRPNAPPGLNQDEAANAWNAWCLLKTGKDQFGQSWPLFYMRALGGNYTTLNIYLLIPFQAVGGLNVWTTRAPAALGGILAVFLAYYVGRRLVGASVGLAAAALMAVSPWAVFNSRWGIEANLCPLLAIVPLAMLLAAGLPPGRREDRPPSIVLAAVAGLLTGVCCYGYAAARLFIPVFVMGIVAVSWRGWWGLLRGRRALRQAQGVPRGGVAAVAAYVIGGALTFGPLAWQHVAHPEGVAKRGSASWLWRQVNPYTGQELPVPAGRKLSLVAGRYLQHYGLDFLFLHADRSEIQAPPGMGQLHWYMLPLLLAGAGLAVARCRRSLGARVLLVWLIVYPAGDVLSSHMVEGKESLHALRSSPGIAGLMLLGALGAVGAGAWLARRNRSVALAAGAALTLAVAGLNAGYYRRFFGEFNRRPAIFHRYHVDLVQATRWLRARLDQYDAVFCTTQGLNQPYIVMLHELRTDPNQWLSWEHGLLPGEWDVHYRAGKLHFMYAVPRTVGRQVVPVPLEWDRALRGLLDNGRPDRVLFVIRHTDMALLRAIGVGDLGSPVHEVRRPDDLVSLELYEATL